MAAAGNTGVVVPVDLVAFCVSESDAIQGTTSFSGATVNYAALTPTNLQAYTGAVANRALNAPPLQPLEAGVHLHWALPDALTKGKADSAAPVKFEAVPNRWLVTRFAISGSTVTPTSFVVESDGLSTTLPAGQYAPLLPVKQQNSQAPGFAYMGLRANLDDYNTQLGQTPLTAATGQPLSAVSLGTPQFAAYYPEGRSSFGFFDALADLAGPAQLMYVVTGWYEDITLDPAQIVAARRAKTLAGRRKPTLRSDYRWSTHGSEMPGEQDEPPPPYTLYSGTTQAVNWNPNGAYVPQGGSLPPIVATAAVGNTPSEALAAYFRNLLHPNIPFFEQILTAFQQGQWPNLSQPTVDMLASLAEKLHTSQFQRVDSNLIWTIYQSDPDGVTHEAINLPPGIADALNDANVARQDKLAVGEHVSTYQWQIFTDWYRYFNQPQGSLNQTTVFNHFAQVLLPQWQGLQAAWTAAQTASDTADTNLRNLIAQRKDLSLREVPGPRYWQPAEPVLLLAGDGLELPARYGGDNDHSDTGTLVCRSTDQIVSALSINGISRSASDYSAVTRLNSNMLPYLADCEALLAEALLLDTQLASGWSNVGEPALRTALKALLTGGQQTQWTITAGAAPSPVEVSWWENANPWIPMFLQWTVDFVPLQPTIVNQTQLENYNPAFFTANYTINPDTGSFISYTPSGPNGINIDPATQTYTPTYSGSALLSDQAPANLENAITQYVKKNSDPTLQAILTALQNTQIVVQPLSGFGPALLDRVLQAQFSLVTPPNAGPAAVAITAQTAAIVGNSYPVGPMFDAAYNPIRAGYFKVSGMVVDAFGQQRQLQIGAGDFYTAESMTTVIGNNTVEPGIGYAAPRISQPSRLLFEWMSANVSSIEEMTEHPATSPVCGWLMPNHLTGGFFLYDGTGRPLGALQVNGNVPPQVVWQGAPGDDATIDEPIAQALADANPLLLQVALALFNATPAFFQSFFRAVDTTHGTVNPQNLSLESGLAVLVGRPVAVVQAAIRIDLQGRPLLNQNTLGCLTSSQWTDTENGLSGVKFPVLLGDADKLDDGLVGFFRQSGSGFDLSTFFSEGADGSDPGVVVPDASTIQLTVTPTLADPDPPPAGAETFRVLMLVDPRAPVHAVTGILPTETLEIPSDISSEALSSLEVYFLAAPVLKPTPVPQEPALLLMPVPAASGFDISFVEQMLFNSKPEWVTVSDIAAATTGAVWNYTPQLLTEGWLRINQTQLTFDLLNSAGKAIVTGGQTQNMTLTIRNAKPNVVTFTPGVLAPEGSKPAGSIFYIHFGQLVDAVDVPSISLAAPSWSFALQQDSIYGAYWAATPVADDVVLQPDGAVTVTVTGLKAASTLSQANLYFDYYAVDGTADGVFTDTIVVSA
ncbi:hypothetical protein [Bradyrhizobium sp. ORS 285]|uniref:hypothetical protein n=1 Tax=Bradyrhizobium sp. ORS 285 TaxID=115808 RepID=UPI0002F60F02|nr:hypothetical protein [Bradyrhizobium sp. ORS 285]